MPSVTKPTSFIPRSPLIALVPELHTFSPQTGIGRVLHSLHAAWGTQVDLLPTKLVSLNLPLLRNFPYGVEVHNTGHIVLLPRLTGAQALRNTGRLPSVAIVHDIGVVDFAGDRVGTDWFTLRSALQSFYGLRYASRIISDSAFTEQRLLHYLPKLADRVSVVHAGVNDTFLFYSRSQAEARQRVEQITGTLRSPLLAYVGSEIPRKNIGLLLEVLATLRHTYPDVQLLKVGAPGHPRWRQKTLATMAQLGLQPGRDVVFLEGINDELLADAYRAADVFVSTSLYEGFGLPALEAMAVGTPVVVTNRGSFPEIVGNLGKAVEPARDAFAQAVAQTLGTKHASTLEQARKRAAHYSWERAAEQYLSILHGIAR